MSPYIINLTNHLIGKNRYDQVPVSSSELRQFIVFSLWIDDVASMSPAKLGEIMASFETGDVMATKGELLALVGFRGDCKELLREMVCACLAYAIWGRLECAEDFQLPSYSRSRKAA